jgi:hypothetical protein
LAYYVHLDGVFSIGTALELRKDRDYKRA